MRRFTWLFLILAVCMPAFAAQMNGPGLHETPMILDDEDPLPLESLENLDGQSLMSVYNTKGEFIVDISMKNGWKIQELHLFIDPFKDEPLEVPIKKDKIDLSKFTHKWEFENPVDSRSMIVPFSELFGKDEFN